MDKATLQIVLEAKNEATGALEKLEKALKDVGTEADKAASKTEKAGSGFGTLIKAAAGFVAFRAVGQFLRESVNEAIAAEAAQAQLGAVLRSTGGVAGVTADQVNELAQSLSQVTTFEDDAIVSAQNLLLTFTQVGKEVFPEAIKTALDMSAALGQDLNGSIIQLGKALQDPINGITALRRVGVNFNDAQQETIKNLVESNKLFEAQKMILEELSTEFGGSATALADTYGGRIVILQNNFNNLKEEIGRGLLPGLEVLGAEMSKAITGINEMSGSTDGLGKIIYSFANLILYAGRGIALFAIAIGSVSVSHLVGAFKGIFGGMKAVADGIKGIGTGLKKLLEGDFSGATEAIGGVFSLPSDFWSGLTSSYADGFKGVMSKVTPLMSALTDDMARNLDEAMNFTNFKAATGSSANPLAKPPGGGAGGGASAEALKAVKSFQDFRDNIGRILQELNFEHDEKVGKINEKLGELDEQYTKVSKEGKKALNDLRQQNRAALKAIDNDIAGVVTRMGELRDAFTKGEAGDRKGLAEQFVAAEEGVKKLKDQLARATDAQQIVDIKNQIRAEEEAINATTEVRKGFEAEISEAKRRAGLTDIQRAIEDFNERRALAQSELSSRMAELEAEKAMLMEKRAFEKKQGQEKMEEAKAQLAERLKEIDTERVAVLTQLKEELELQIGKITFINDLIKQAFDYRNQVATDSFNQTKVAVEKEIELYKKLEQQISRAASAKGTGLIKSKSLGSRDAGGPIPKTGMYLMHEGEYVLNRRESNGGGGDIIINMNGGTYLSEDVAEQIGNKMLDKLKTNRRL